MADPAASSLVLVDWLIIGAYLAVCLAIGWWAMRRIRDVGSYLLAERKLGKLMSMAETFAGAVNANDPVNITATTYKSGISGIWQALYFVVLTPWFWMIRPVGRRVRCVTGLDIVRYRFGVPLERIWLVLQLPVSMLGLGVGVQAAATVVTATSGGSISPLQAQAMVIVPTIVYCLMGGIIAVCATDLFMSILILVLSFVLIPLAIWHVGSTDMLAHVPDTHFTLFSTDWSPGADDWSVCALAWMVLGSLFVAGNVNPTGAANEIAARVGSLGLLFKRICTVGWAAIGLFAVVIFGGAQLSGIKPDEMFGRMCGELLPDGLRGVMVASVLAAVMSTVAAGMVSFSGVFVKNLYQPLLRPVAPAGEYLLAARVVSAVILLLAWWLINMLNKGIIDFSFAVLFVGGLMGVPMLLSFLWRRVTAWGAIAGMAFLAVSYALIHLAAFPGPWVPEAFRDLARGVAHLYGWLSPDYGAFLLSKINAMMLPENRILDATGAVIDYKAKTLPLAIYQPIYLIPGILATVVVSLLTRQHDERSVREFYARVDTPVGEEQRLIDQGIQVDMVETVGGTVVVDPKHHDVQKRLLVLDLFYLPGLIWRREVSWRDYRVDLIGIAGSVVVWIVFFGGLYLAGQWLIERHAALRAAGTVPPALVRPVSATAAAMPGLRAATAAPSATAAPGR